MTNLEIKAERPLLLTQCDKIGQDIYDILGTITYPENKSKVTSSKELLKNFRPLFKRLIEIDYQFTVNDNGMLNEKLKKYAAKLIAVSEILEDTKKELEEHEKLLSSAHAELGETKAAFNDLDTEFTAFKKSAKEAVSRTVGKLHEASEGDIPEYKEGAEEIDPRRPKEIQAGLSFKFDKETGHYTIFHPDDEEQTPIRVEESFAGGGTRRRNRQRRGRKSRR